MVFRAFEEGTLPPAACGAHIEELTKKTSGLEARRAVDEELAAGIRAQRMQLPPAS